MGDEQVSVIRDPLLAVAFLLGPPVSLVFVDVSGRGYDVAAVFMLIAVAPLFEEILFRGWLQGVLLRNGWAQRSLVGVSGANAITASLFALFHWPRGGGTLALGVLPLGLLFGWFRERHQGVMTPILLHAWYNACLVVASALDGPIVRALNVGAR